LKIRNVEGYRNYDKSEFAGQSALLGGDDEALEGVYNQMYDLNEFTDPSNYKTYDELKSRLQMVLGERPLTTPQRVELEQVSEPAPMRSAPAPEPRAAATDDDEDTMSFFAKLANED
jgi:hypothetical protein